MNLTQEKLMIYYAEANLEIRLLKEENIKLKQELEKLQKGNMPCQPLKSSPSLPSQGQS